MKKKFAAVMTAAMMAAGALTGCGGSQTTSDTRTAGTAQEGKEAGTTAAETTAAESESILETAGEEEDESTKESVELIVFAAASMTETLTEIAEMYKEVRPEVEIVYTFDSSGTLKTQIQEGADCDIFISAAQKQMNQLEEDGLMVEGSRANVVNNQVVVITWKGSNTKVTGLENLEAAESLALAGGSVPVGRYTRQALINLGKLEAAEDAAQITTDQVSQALGGVEISEQSNVSKVLLAVAEGSCEVGTTYYSDTYGYEDKLEILETVDYELSGNVIYPIAQVKNPEADEAQTKAAREFMEYILSEDAKSVFQSYYFDTDV